MRTEKRTVDGVEYERAAFDDHSFGPVFEPVERGRAFICECGSRSFFVFRNGEYDTSVSCSSCGKTESVHQG